MKCILIFLLFFSVKAISQAYDSTANYGDTTITLTLTQRSAVYIGFYIKNSAQVWSNRLAPATLKNYVGTGTHLDSLFSVSLKANYISGMIDLLLTGQDEVVQADRLSIVNNSPTITGYTSLANQIVTKANGSSNEKNVAIYLRAYYNDRIAQSAALRAQNISNVVQWSQN